MHNIVQIGVIFTASIITWNVTTVQVKAGTLGLGNSSITKTQDLEAEDDSYTVVAQAPGIPDNPGTNPSAVPEPSTIIASITATGLILARKRKIKSSQST